jgi:hypothetical protein
MDFKPPFHEKILDLVLNINIDSSTRAYWEAHAEIRKICETHENTVLDHPFQWETLADFTHDKNLQISAYLKALKLAQKMNHAEYITSIAVELSELFIAENNAEQAIAYCKLAKDAAYCTNDSQLQIDVDSIEKRLL